MKNDLKNKSNSGNEDLLHFTVYIPHGEKPRWDLKAGLEQKPQGNSDYKPDSSGLFRCPFYPT